MKTFLMDRGDGTLVTLDTDAPRHVCDCHGECMMHDAEEPLSLAQLAQASCARAALYRPRPDKD